MLGFLLGTPIFLLFSGRAKERTKQSPDGAGPSKNGVLSAGVRRPTERTRFIGVEMADELAKTGKAKKSSFITRTLEPAMLVASKVLT
ncbi:MAG: hypothetical protein U9P10_02650 [Thermodesulfobacteriota bacterium]|nr:hypothetical protein [Thermodesulfobacteriota bacterium]